MTATFLFDGDCAFCTSTARWMERAIPSQARVEPWQFADLEALGVTAAACQESVQWINGVEKASGPDAVAAYMRTSPQPWRSLGAALDVASPVAWPIYRLVSKNRNRLPGGTPACRADRSTEADRPRRRIKVRRRKGGDLRACANLLAIVHRTDGYPTYYPAAPRSWLSGQSVLDAWVVEQRGDVVGHIAITSVAGGRPVDALRWRELTGHPVAEMAGISRLFVHPRVRRTGVASALVDRALREIRGRGLVPALDVVDSGSGAIQLYEALGWRLLATYPWGKPADSLQVRFYAAPADGAIPAPH